MGIQVRSKVWLEAQGRPVRGPGRLKLLQYISAQGSISQAARLLEMTYRKAWGQIRAMEELLGLPLVEKQAGGAGGGRARLTPRARALLSSYVRLAQGIGEEIDRRFKVFFCDDR